MSAFLGPIHYWLYNKIQLQQELVEEIIELGKEKKCSLKKEIDTKYGLSETRALEEVIDQTNIHRWLQEFVSQVENKLAYSVTKLLDKDPDSMKEMQAIFYQKGKEKSSAIQVDNASTIYKAISDCLLDGMPCDHAYSLLEEREDQVIWKRNTCVHKHYWEEQQGDVANYYLLREAFILGFLEGTTMEFHKLDDETGEIKRKGDVNMDSIELMVEEHRYIVRMLKVVRKACSQLLKGEEIVYEDFDKMIDFIKNYADVHHHGKEEKILFTEMTAHMGKIGANLITHGMLVEHDLGRLYMSELKEALKKVKNGDEDSKLDVIANAVGYTNLLTRHIAKEDEVIYPFAVNKLPAETLQSIHERVADFEQDAEKGKIQEHYVKILEELENKQTIIK